MNRQMKKHRKRWIFLIAGGVAALALVLVWYLIQPYWFLYQNLTKSKALHLCDVVSQFSEPWDDAKASERGILYEAIPDGSGETVFLSREVTEIGDGLYICGLYGMTNWAVDVVVYSHENFENTEWENPEDSRWKVEITCVGSEENEYVKQWNQTQPLKEAGHWGYTGHLILPSPKHLETDTLQLLVWDTGNPQQKRTVSIAVETSRIP